MAVKVNDLKNQVKSKSNFYTYGILFLSGILLSLSTQYFVMEAQIFSPGISGISQGISYIISDIFPSGDVKRLQVLSYWLIYASLNAPIFYFMFRWYGVKFSSRTITVFVTSFLLGMLIANVSTFKDLQIIPKVDSEDFAGKEILSFMRTFLLSVMGAAIFALSVGLAFKNGGSTAGTDPLVKYLSREKGINLSKVLFLVGIGISFTFIVIRSFTNNPVQDLKEFLDRTIVSAEFISTITFLIIYSKITEAIYSPTKLVEVSIVSQKNQKISDFLNNSNYHRGHTLVETIGGYSRNKALELKIVLNIEEFDDFVRRVETIDHNAMITAHWINKLYDLHDWTPLTEYDKELREKKKVSSSKKHNKQS